MNKSAVSSENLSIAKLVIVKALKTIPFVGSEEEVNRAKVELSSCFQCFLEPNSYEDNINALKLEDNNHNNINNNISDENLLMARDFILNLLAETPFIGDNKDVAIEKAELALNIRLFLDPNKYAVNIRTLSYREQKRNGRNR